jgi:hypothetical protein
MRGVANAQVHKDFLICRNFEEREWAASSIVTDHT